MLVEERRRKTRVPGENLSKQKIQREPTTLPEPTNC